MSLYTRIAIVICSLVFFAASVSAGLIYWRLNEHLVDAKLDELNSETEIQATRFLGGINELIRDTKFISGTPPVQGMIRALDNNGIDPFDGSRLDVWKQRLGVIFQEMLVSKPNYVQIRYIGIADNGLELVRADRQGEDGAIRLVPKDELQPKGERDYFKQTIQTEKGSVYLSPVELNREYGRIQEPYEPVLRAALSVFNKSGQLFGIIVINLGFNSILNELSRVSNTSHQYYLVNEQGYYLKHADSRQEFGFEFGNQPTASRDFPVIEKIIRDKGKNVATGVRTDGEVVSARRIKFGSHGLQHSVSIIVVDSFDDITAISRVVFQQAGLVIALLVLMGLMLGLWLARRVTQPIVTLTDSLKHMDVRAVEWDRPDELTAEAGKLSEALGTVFESLKIRTNELAATNRELNQFAYIASHDLQEPVRTISSFTDLIARQYGELFDERGKKYLAFITDSCTRMRSLIHGLLEYSRLGSHSKPEVTDIGHLIESIKADMQNTVKSTGAEIKVGNMPTLRVYPVEMHLLLQNLISNAIKYVPQGRRPVVELQAARDGNVWLFSVSDNGVGIAEEHREKIFLIFQRLHAMDEYEGTGIGLANCVKVAELHRGRIWVEKAPAGGACFRFTIQEVKDE